VPESRWPRRAASGLAAWGLLLGCAGAPPPEADLASILPEAKSELRHAPPAARDALEEGLRWIVLDAPGTNAAPPAPAPAEPTAGDIAESPATLSPATPPAPAAVASAAPSPDRRASALYVTLAQLNLRQGPGVDQTILAVLPAGTEVTAHDVSGEWARVATPWRGEGWVKLSWLEQRSGPEDSSQAPPASPPTASRGAEP
jgi:pyruvate/2-oxoglutarate dehydrogenase complex dihydrolipoamide acyltransferase (E2) component